MNCVKLRHLSEFKLVINGKVCDDCEMKENILVNLTLDESMINNQTIIASASIELRNFSPILLGNPRVTFENDVICTFKNSISLEISNQVESNQTGVSINEEIQIGSLKSMENLGREPFNYSQAENLRQADIILPKMSLFQQSSSSPRACLNSLLSLLILLTSQSLR